MNCAKWGEIYWSLIQRMINVSLVNPQRQKRVQQHLAEAAMLVVVARGGGGGALLRSDFY